MIWICMIGLALAAAMFIAFPFFQRRTMESAGGDATMSIYADQLEEVERDKTQGLISSLDAEAATSEIERRRNQFARHLPSGLSISERTWAGAAVTVLVIGAAALGGYTAKGTPAAVDMPLAERHQDILEQRAAAGDLNSRIKLLVQQTEETPEDFQSWWALARSYSAVGDNASSAEAYRQAVMLDDSPGVLSAYAEAMTLANGNKVPKGAEIIFAQVVREVNDPRAMYYLALARAQRQDFEGALSDWSTLAQASDPNAPWMALVRRDIANMARYLERDVTLYLPDATEAEIAFAKGIQAIPEDEIDGLRQSLAADPKDYEGWIALAEAESKAGRLKVAAEALAEGRSHFQSAPYVLQKFAEAERAFGLDLLSGPTRGPDAEDIAAASDMTEDERAAMIEGMVAGLAARLQDAPNDPDGWVMLIRSYRTLGDEEKANEALLTVNDVFKGTPELAAILAAI
jgi:cytochrome c-type biogenesis protein CcmH